MVVFTAEEFEKMEAAWGDDSLNVEKIKLLEQKIDIMDSTEVALNHRVFLLNRQLILHKDKFTLSVEREGLINEKVIVYKSLYEDTEKMLLKKSGKKGFFNNAFWFGFGSLFGVGTLYIGSKIINNIN